MNRGKSKHQCLEVPPECAQVLFIRAQHRYVRAISQSKWTMIQSPFRHHSYQVSMVQQSFRNPCEIRLQISLFGSHPFHDVRTIRWTVYHGGTVHLSYHHNTSDRKTTETAIISSLAIG